MEKHDPDPQWRCNCHAKHAEKLRQLDKDIEENKEDHSKFFEAIGKRATNKFFIVLVLLVVGMLGFQWTNYEKLSEKIGIMNIMVVERMTAIETKLSSHVLYKRNFNSNPNPNLNE